MKNFLPLLFLCFFACEKDINRVPPTCFDGGYQQGDEVVLPDFTTLQLMTINSYFCPCDVMCIRAGNCDVVLTHDNGFRDTLLLDPIRRFSPDGTVTLTGATIEYNDYTISIDTFTTIQECNQEADNYCIRFNFD